MVMGQAGVDGVEKKPFANKAFRVDLLQRMKILAARTGILQTDLHNMLVEAGLNVMEAQLDASEGRVAKAPGQK